MVPATLLPGLSFYSIDYQADAPLVRGAGCRVLSPEEVTESCEYLLAAARHYGCARWLVDSCHDPRRLPVELYEWLQHDFFPRVRAALGQPLRLALLVAPDACGHMRQHQYRRPQDGHTPDVCIGWFSTEACARQWLNEAPLRLHK